jgi:ABC-2 type transport system permease protein
MANYILCTALMTIALIVALGTAAGLTAGIALGDIGRYVPELVSTALIQLPAIFVLGSIGCLLFGILPRGTIAVWGIYALSMLGGPVMSALVSLPHWAQNLSAFSHTPGAPAEPVTALPLVTMSGIAVLCTVAGLVAFRRRNVANF